MEEKEIKRQLLFGIERNSGCFYNLSFLTKSNYRRGKKHVLAAHSLHIMCGSQANTPPFLWAQLSLHIVMLLRYY